MDTVGDNNGRSRADGHAGHAGQTHDVSLPTRPEPDFDGLLCLEKAGPSSLETRTPSAPPLVGRRSLGSPSGLGISLIGQAASCSDVSTRDLVSSQIGGRIVVMRSVADGARELYHQATSFSPLPILHRPRTLDTGHSWQQAKTPER